MKKINFTKNEFAEQLSKKTGLSNLYTKKLLNDFINIIIINISKTKYKIKNIGTFKVINKNSRVGRNPKTKKKFVINARKSISFIPSKKLLENLNQY